MLEVLEGTRVGQLIVGCPVLDAGGLIGLSSHLVNGDVASGFLNGVEVDDFLSALERIN